MIYKNWKEKFRKVYGRLPLISDIISAINKGAIKGEVCPCCGIPQVFQKFRDRYPDRIHEFNKRRKK